MTRVRFILPMISLLASQAAVARTDTSFTYQGVLNTGSMPYSGTADYRFTLWTAAAGGAQIGPAFTAGGVEVENGLFTAAVDFGAEAHGPGRHLRIEVRTPAWDGTGDEPPFFTFPDRTALTGAPYSLSTRGIFVNEGGERVGIGTEGPTHTLHVAGQERRAMLVESADALGTWLNLLNSSEGGRFWRLVSTGAGNGEGAGNLLIGHGDGSGAHSSVMALLGSGEVGIGTTSPKQRLHVNGDLYARGHLWLHAAEGDGEHGTAYIQARDDSGASSIGMRLRTQNGGSLVDAMHIGATGNIGIGTTSPQDRIDLNSGALRFPDDTRQTTAYRPIIVNVPLSATAPIQGGSQLERGISGISGAMPGMTVVVTPPYRLWPFHTLGYAYVESPGFVVFSIVSTGGPDRAYGAGTWRITVLP